MKYIGIDTCWECPNFHRECFKTFEVIYCDEGAFKMTSIDVEKYNEFTKKIYLQSQIPFTCPLPEVKK